MNQKILKENLRKYYIEKSQQLSHVNSNNTASNTNTTNNMNITCDNNLNNSKLSNLINNLESANHIFHNNQKIKPSLILWSEKIYFQIKEILFEEIHVNKSKMNKLKLKNLKEKIKNRFKSDKNYDYLYDISLFFIEQKFTPNMENIIYEMIIKYNDYDNIIEMLYEKYEKGVFIVINSDEGFNNTGSSNFNTNINQYYFLVLFSKSTKTIKNKNSKASMTRLNSYMQTENEYNNNNNNTNGNNYENNQSNTKNEILINPNFDTFSAIENDKSHKINKTKNNKNMTNLSNLSNFEFPSLNNNNTNKNYLLESFNKECNEFYKKNTQREIKIDMKGNFLMNFIKNTNIDYYDKIIENKGFISNNILTLCFLLENGDTKNEVTCLQNEELEKKEGKNIINNKF